MATELVEERALSALSSSTTWRVRDAADSLLARRGLRSTSIIDGKIDTDDEDDDDEIPDMVLSKHFDVDACQSRLRRDKTPIVKMALDAGASAILENLHKADDDDESDKKSQQQQLSKQQQQLPLLLEDVLKLQELRVASMERARANKDLSKRRIAVAKEQEQERLFHNRQLGVENLVSSAETTTSNAAMEGAEGGNGPTPDATSTGSSTTRVKLENPAMPSPCPVASKNNTNSGAIGSAASPDAVGSSSKLPQGHDKGSSAKGKPQASSSLSVKKELPQPPKFTRNTPASSSSALESRLTGSRAILCTAANVAFDVLTPALPEWETIDVSDVPQNPEASKTVIAGDEAAKNATVPSMGPVIVEAQMLGKRIENVATNAAKRSKRRFRFRKDNIQFQNNNGTNYRSIQNNKTKGKGQLQERGPGFRILKNPFAWNDDEEDDSMDVDETVSIVTADNSTVTNSDATSKTWEKVCIPRLFSILQTGIGNAMIHDVMWSTRHGRIANLLQEISKMDNENDAFFAGTGISGVNAVTDRNFGPHLIVTVGPDVDRFAREFKAPDSHLRLMSTVDEESLRAMPYRGTKEEKRKLRKRFPLATGLKDASFHVIIVSYADFLTDYIHFCQTPFEMVILDDGVSWMAAAHNDPNSPIATVWEDALFSKNDHQMGLAGTTLKKWDYGIESIKEDVLKETWIGLTARHRLVTASKLRVENPRSPDDLLPISGILSVVLPHFSDAVKEEWDRSRISNDASSMSHFRKLLTRSLVVHDPATENEETSIYELAMKALRGERSDPIRSGDDPPVPEEISDEQFIADNKVASSRRSALQWLGPLEDSWLRYELGRVSFEPILAAMKTSLNHGHICEEITTALSITAGATGQIIGNLAFKMGVRSGKSFGSEQGLRQHLSTHHAPPGTWLCRTCKIDCITSQARTHHERSCGQPSGGTGKKEAAAASGTSKKDTTSKKKGKTSKGGAGATKEEKDADGSVRVTTGLGGGVVPALSVINIKDLPPDVKPLLRDPRQTSRTGGNSKRHVYAYRGVCRQARKGHDRWQSQISFLGVNHYLGTFDSEWDAAAVYAWAHLILYGEEATRQAQKEGEEAAAAYEQEKKDIAAGKIPAAPPKPEKKDKAGSKKKAEDKAGAKKGGKDAATSKDDKATKRKPGRPKKKAEETPTKQPPGKRIKAAAADKEDIASILAQSVGKATILAPVPKFAEMSDEELMTEAAARMVAARSVNYCVTEVALPAPIHMDFRPCIPRGEDSGHRIGGGALLVGLDPSLFGWNIDSIVSKQYFGSDSERKNATLALTEEFGRDGLNQHFRSLVQGSTTVIGCASSRMKRVYSSLGMGSPPMGGPIGSIDCNTAGNPKCCSETAACIRYAPTETSDFQLSALGSDLITMNGQRITPEMGSFPLFNEDICTIGSRVFLFLLPSDA